MVEPAVGGTDLTGSPEPRRLVFVSAFGLSFVLVAHLVGRIDHIQPRPLGLIGHVYTVKLYWVDFGRNGERIADSPSA